MSERSARILLLTEKLSSCMSEDAIVTVITSAFNFLGFQRARYYDFNTCPSTGEKYYTLRASSHLLPRLEIGDRIFCASLDNAQDCELVIETCVIGTLADASSRDEWIMRIGLEGQVWIDISIICDDQRVGMWALDRPATESIGAEETEILLRLGHYASLRLNFLLHKQQREYVKRFPEINWLGTKHLPSISALSLIGQSVSARFVALFLFDPVVGQLTKSFELLCDANGTYQTIPSPDLKEEYLPGSFLTGKAWVSQKYQLIPSLDDIKSNEPHLVCEQSLEYHKRVSGSEMVTVMYQKINVPGCPPGMVRVMNRCDQSALGFTQLHHSTFEHLCIPLAQVLSVDDTVLRISKYLSGFKEALDRLNTSRVTFALISKSLEALLEALGLNRASLSIWNAQHELAENWAISPGSGSQSKPIETSHYATRGLQFSKVGMYHKPDVYLEGELPEEIRTLVAPIDAQAYYIQAVRDADAHNGRTFLVAFGLVDRRATKNYLLESKKIWRNLPSRLRILDVLTSFSRVIIELAEARTAYYRAHEAVSRITHDIRGPVSAMQNLGREVCRTYSELLADKTVPDDVAVKVMPMDYGVMNFKAINGKKAIEKWIDETQQNFDSFARHASSIIDTSFDWASIAAGKLHLTQVLLYNILQKCSNELQKEFAKKPFVILRIRDNVKRVPPFFADEPLLRTLFFNLLDNAIKYSHNRFPQSSRRFSSEIIISAERQTRIVDIKITNFGLGIREEDSRDIFKIFSRRSESDPLEKYKGVGLGLSTAWDIVEAHKGSISCQSVFVLGDNAKREQLKGYETTFTVRLPLDLKASLYSQSEE